jgi:hypothetical protein
MAGPGRCLEATPPNQSLDTDRGRILSIRGVRSLQRPRQGRLNVCRDLGKKVACLIALGSGGIFPHRGKLAVGVQAPLQRSSLGSLQAAPQDFDRPAVGVGGAQAVEDLGRGDIGRGGAFHDLGRERSARQGIEADAARLLTKAVGDLGRAAAVL